MWLASKGRFEIINTHGYEGESQCWKEVFSELPGLETQYGFVGTLFVFGCVCLNQTNDLN